MSSLTSGSQLSFNAKLADVWRICTWNKPTENWHISGICLSISSVTKCTPLCCGRRLTLRWNHAEPIWMPLFEEAMLNDTPILPGAVFPIFLLLSLKGRQMCYNFMIVITIMFMLHIFHLNTNYASLRSYILLWEKLHSKSFTAPR